MLRYIARCAPEAIGLYGGGKALTATQIDYWVDYATENVVPGANFEVGS